jgi:hypothetical protein
MQTGFGEEADDDQWLHRSLQIEWKCKIWPPFFTRLLDVSLRFTYDLATGSSV